MLVRCCLILHNLILRIEGGNFNPEFREELFAAGQQDWRDVNGWYENNYDNLDTAPDLQEAQRALETDGQRFRKLIMKRLFDSPNSGAIHRPDGVRLRNNHRGGSRGQRGHRGTRGQTRGHGRGRGARRCT